MSMNPPEEDDTLLFHVADPLAVASSFRGSHASGGTAGAPEARSAPGKRIPTIQPSSASIANDDGTPKPCVGCEARKAAIGNALAPLARLIFGK